MKVKLAIFFLFLAVIEIFPQGATVLVEAPNGGESWKVGSNQNIKWNSSNITNVKIDYSTDNGSSWVAVANNVPAANKNFSWTIPNTPSSNCKVRISDAANPATSDESDNIFTIPNLQVSSPNGSERWQAGTSHNITWSNNCISNVKIEYSTNNGSSWTEIVASYPANSGTYSWIVPNTPSLQCKIKISDASNPTVYDVSNNVFSIVNLSLTSPNGYENWMVSSVYPITWNCNNINSVRVFLSTNNGNSWDIEITSQLINQTQNYAEWTVTDNPSDQCKIKIMDAADASIYDVSDNSFVISKLVLTNPNGGESYLTGQTQNITWTRSNNINNVKLEYTTNNGTSWITIANSINAVSGSYAWTVPSLTSTQCKIKISNVAASQIYDVSNNVFSISKSINVISPNGNENWIVGTKHNITWSTSVNNIKIEYTSDNGANWNLVASPVAGNSGIYQWTIPYTLSTTCKIRISDISNLDNYDESDEAFHITNSASITLTSPAGNENWQAGTTKNITWQSENVTDVKIDYSTNNGVYWNNVISSTPSDGTYSWQIPNLPSSQCKVRVSDINNSNTFDESNIFTISYLKLLYPDGGDNWLVDSSYTIKWNSNNVSSFKLYISRNSGINWTEITNSLSNFTNTSAIWTPDEPVSGLCKIKISDANNATIFDTSKNVFNISILKLTSPAGGENIQAGVQKNITWRSNFTGNVRIEYTTNNGTAWNVIATVPGNSESYSWTVPNTLSNQYKVRISDAVDPDIIYDESKSNFTVSSITITAPNGNEKWYIGSSQSIKWTSSYISRVRIQYSLNNGVDWIDIESNYPSAGIYSWTVPTTASTQCRIRIVSVDANCTTSDISDNVFAIAPTLKVTSPNGNENWQVGTKQNISWTVESSDNPIQNVKIEYSTNNGAIWNVVAASVSASLGTYQWTIPSTPSNSCKIKVSNVTQSSSYDISDACFIISTLSVLSPNGSESWQVDSTEKITWVSNYVSTVNIEYSINNGITWNTIASNISSIPGSYNWTIPNTPTAQCKIKITNSANLENYDVSDNTFTIASLKLTSPNGGESFQAGQSKNITWVSSNISNVKLEYSTNNGAAWNTIIALTAAGTCSYSWTVPNIISGSCKVKISDVLKPEVYDISDNVFFISNLSVITPNGGETWQSGSSQNITWNTSPDISNIKIEYSSNNSTTWNTIASSVPASSGTYAWSVPSVSSTSCKVRISSVANSTISDNSDNNFTIASLSLTSPNGGESCQVGQIINITWTSSNINSIKLEYSTNNGTSWNTITASFNASTSTYSWLVPNTPSQQCKIRISDGSSPNVYDISDNLFFISTLTLTSPNGGETWQSGSSQNITWNTSPDISNIKIEYSSNNSTTWNTIALSVPASNGTYDWSVPSVSSTSCKVRISSVANSTISDNSDNNFTIASLNLTSPNGGESCQVGQTIDIFWTSSNINSVKLEYSTNNGTSWNLIAASVPASTGTYTWILPNTPSFQCKVKISDAGKPDISDISNESFIINVKTSIQILSPNGNENWQSGSSKLITWSSENVNQIKLEYSLNNGTEWILIADSITSSGTYEWLVPSSTSIQARIKITDVKNASNYDVSDKVFTISDIELTLPNDNDRILVGSRQNITWKSKNIESIKIEFSPDDGITWNLVAASYSANSQTYEWIVPNTLSSHCKIRISDVANQGISSKSIGSFIITPIQITSPGGNENWKTNSIQKILWKCSSDIKKVKIEYSTDKGINWTDIVSSFTAARNSYDWTVPDYPSENCLVRISDTSNVDFYDVSKSNFAINVLELSAPNGGETWISNSTQNITWKSKYISNVSIFYSINNGSDWISISNSVPSTGSFAWLVPELSSTQCKIKICSAKDNSVEDYSDNIFEIKSLSSISDKLKARPDQFALLQNYPNPFNPSTTIWYSVPELSRIEIKVYNILGKEVAALVNEEKAMGNYMITFNASNLPCGVYFYRITALPVSGKFERFTDTKKLILLK